MNTDEMRKAFEHWYSDEGQYPKAVERDSKGRYVLMGATAAWDAWQAGWKCRGGLIEELAFALEQMTDHYRAYVRHDGRADWETEQEEPVAAARMAVARASAIRSGASHD
jgi:hypothetical protein